MSSPFRWLAFLGIALADERQTKWLLEHPDADTRHQLRKKAKRLEAKFATVEAEIDRAYWAFTRQARGKLAEAAGVLVEGAGDYVRVTFPEKPEREVLEALRAADFHLGRWILDRAPREAPRGSQGDGQ